MRTNSLSWPVRLSWLSALVLATQLVTGCGQKSLPAAGGAPGPSAGSGAPAKPVAFANYTCEVVNRYPHDPDAFTQGLFFLDANTLIEGTGLNRRSSLRRVDLASGKVSQKVDLPDRYFGEGTALLKGKIYQLTWQDRKGFIYDAATLQQEGEFPYTGEGWGLTTDGSSLILSDGTDQIRFLDPATFKVIRTIKATHQGKPVDHLNELEFIKGEIFANIWGSDLIARLDPATGVATGVINCTSVFPPGLRSSPDQLLNGIAWHEPTQRLLITGKLWPTLFEVKLIKAGP
jgi:glutamine cyclotransferase